MTRLDKLGRKIPDFDRVAAGKKAAKTRKENYGDDFDARTGSVGGKHRGPGNFGTLKKTNPDELKRLATKGAEATNKLKAEKRSKQDKS